MTREQVIEGLREVREAMMSVQQWAENLNAGWEVGAPEIRAAVNAPHDRHHSWQRIDDTIRFLESDLPAPEAIPDYCPQIETPSMSPSSVAPAVGRDERMEMANLRIERYQDALWHCSQGRKCAGCPMDNRLMPGRCHAQNFNHDAHVAAAQRPENDHA